MKRFLLLSFFVSTKLISQTGWIPVSSFGTNPGNLNMYAYVPAGLTGPAALVVAMHGCTQNALTCATESGWNTLADRHGFYVLYPEQVAANNSSNCFNWFQSGDQDRGQGEALSIKQMVDNMKANYLIDTNKIFVTGLSAGASMTTVMLACYPDVFKKGAVMAGGPYKCATNASQAISAMSGFVTNTPQNWGTLVTNAYPGFTGTYPTVAVFHGSADNVVNVVNATEIMKQWTNLHQADQTADVVFSSYNGNAFVTRNVFNDANGIPAVETYILSGMGHAIALDTGVCYQQCGKTGTYAYEVYFSSTFFAASFFNIVIAPYVVPGLQNVAFNQTGVVYSVTNSGGSAYTWSVPAGASIVSGQGTNQITVNFGTSSGYVEVIETQGTCKTGPVKLFVTVGSNAVHERINEEIQLFQVDEKSFMVRSQSASNIQLKLYDSLGNLVFDEFVPCNVILSPNMNGGLYVAGLRTKNTTLQKKLFILH